VHKKKLLTRLVPGAVVAAVTAGSVWLGNGAAGAAVPAGTLGSVAITPATGTDTSSMDGQTSGPCPAATRAVDQTIVGPVRADGPAPDATATFPDSNPFPVTGTTGSTLAFSTKRAFHLPFSDTLVNDATLRGKTIQAGEYHVVIECTDSFGPGGQVFGTFTGGLIFSDAHNYTVIPNGTGTPTPIPTGTPAPSPPPTSSPTPAPSLPPTSSPTPTPTAPPTSSPTPPPTPGAGALGTKTRLDVIRVRLPFRLGGFVLPFAHVVPHATGTVQFKDETANLGGLVPVNAGFGFGGFVVLPPGPHSLTAEFTPADPQAFQPSTSDVVRFTF
jgi:hypothetical protein